MQNEVKKIMDAVMASDLDIEIKYGMTDRMQDDEMFGKIIEVDIREIVDEGFIICDSDALTSFLRGIFFNIESNKAQEFIKGYFIVKTMCIDFGIKTEDGVILKEKV